MQQSNVLRFVHVRSPRVRAVRSVPTLEPDETAAAEVAGEIEKAQQVTGPAGNPATGVANARRADSKFSRAAHRSALEKKSAVEEALKLPDAQSIRTGLTDALGDDLDRIRTNRSRIDADLQAIQLAPQSAPELQDLVWLARVARVASHWDDDDALVEAARTFNQARPALALRIAEAFERGSPAVIAPVPVSDASADVERLLAERESLARQLEEVRALRQARIETQRALDDLTDQMFAEEMSVTPAAAVNAPASADDQAKRLAHIAAALQNARKKAIKTLGLPSGQPMSTRLQADDIKKIEGLDAVMGPGPSFTFETVSQTLDSRLAETTRELTRAMHLAKERR